MSFCDLCNKEGSSYKLCDDCWSRLGLLEKEPFISFPKTPRLADRNYLNFIKSRTCVACGRHSDPHHTKTVGAGGDDYMAVPLCRLHHTEYHIVGKVAFEFKYHLDFPKCVYECLVAYIRLLERLVEDDKNGEGKYS